MLLSQSGLLARATHTKSFQHRCTPFQSSHAPHRRSLRCRAEDDKPGRTAVKDKDKEKVDKYVESLKQGGVDQKVAQKVVDTWRELGADADVGQLRKMFLKQSAAPFAALLLNTVLELAAAYLSYTSGIYFAIGPDFFGRGALVFFSNFIAFYFATGVLVDIVRLVLLTIVTIRLEVNSEFFMEAVKQIAGPPSGLSLADKAQAAVNTLKVSQALSGIAGLLSTAAASQSEEQPKDTLQSLASFLALAKAEQEGNFDAAALGMSEADKRRIARVFARYDANDDGRLGPSEVARMVQDLGMSLNDGELRAAVAAMDENKDGTVQLNEFAAWWVKNSGRAGANSSN